jgi:hypothetical protein
LGFLDKTQVATNVQKIPFFVFIYADYSK